VFAPSLLADFRASHPLWVALEYHCKWPPGRVEIAAAGGADRRSAKNADRPLNQSREALLAAWPLHSPEGGQSAAVVAADWPHEGHDQHEPAA
jgi:hypothetical protein